MTYSRTHVVDPNLDLVLERIIDVPKELVWKAWTRPEHIVKWWTPAPWSTVDCDIDPRPGGVFRTVMRSPEGETYPNEGCYLEIIENEKLIWTNAMLTGFRPKAALPGVPLITAIITFESQGQGTKYTATVLHGDQEQRLKHEGMGFYDGWGTATDQMIELVKTW